MARIRAQVSLEFILLVTFVVLVTTTLLYVFGNRMHDISNQNETETAENFLQIFIQELSMGKRAMNGYSHAFNVSSMLGYSNYTIQIDDNIMLYINYSERTYPKDMPDGTMGGFCINYSEQKPIFEMVVMRINDTVWISSSPDSQYSYFECDTANRTAGGCNAQEAAHPGFKDECCDNHCRCCP